MTDVDPPWVRWLAAFASALALSSALGALTPVGAGNAVFFTGVAAVFWSLAYVRFGGDKTPIWRDLKGKATWGVDPQLRRAEIRKGIAIFLVGLGLFAFLLLTIVLG